MTIEYHKARTLAEAVALNAAHQDMPVLAGGTDLIVQWRAGVISPPGFVDISCVDEMHGIAENGDFVEIGAAATHASIYSSANVRLHLGLLALACSSVGAVQIQNRGTIGGNIMNASPAGDTLPVLLVYDAEFLLQDVKGERWVAARDFFVSYRKTLKRADELLTKIRIKKSQDLKRKTAFYKIGTRRAQAISKIVMAVSGAIEHGGITDVAIGIGSVAAMPVRAYGTEALLRGKMITEALIGQARRSIMDEFTPIDDVRSTAEYRKYVTGRLIERFLRS